MIQRYSIKEIEEIWSDANKYQIWAEIETAYINNSNLIGLKDKSKRQKSEFDDLDNLVCPEITATDISEIKEIESDIGHDVNAFVQWYNTHYFSSAHLGLTSSDIVDTCFAIQCKAVNTIIKSERISYNKAISKLNVPKTLWGRSHGQNAELISGTHKKRQWMIPSAIYINDIPGKLSGSMGDNKHCKLYIERRVLKSLGVKKDKSSFSQIVNRSHYCNLYQSWANVSTHIAKVATDLRILAHSGIKEVVIKRNSKYTGSSSMAHKNNPTELETICGLNRIIRSLWAAVSENVITWHERDISHSSVERIAFPIASNLLVKQLRTITDLITNKIEFNVTITEDDQKQSDTQHSMIEECLRTGDRLSSYQSVKQKSQNR